MRKILIFNILVIGILTNVTSQTNLESLKNPYRGFRHELILLVQPDGSVVDAWSRNAIDVQSYINGKNSHFGSSDKHVRLCQTYIYLTDFTGRSISTEALNTIQGIFDVFKTNNLQMLLRWVYDYGGPDATNSGISNVTFEDITTHLNQLAPIAKANDGVICNMNGGLLGIWGEWHSRSTELIADADGIDNMFKEVLEDHLPEYMQTQVRVPTYKTTRNLPQKLIDRIGFHNDFFTAGEHHKASGNDYIPGDNWYQITKEQSPYVIVDGEMPYEGDTEWHIKFAIDIYKTLKIFKEHHYTSFSLAHSYLLNTGAWRNVTLDKVKMLSESGGIRYHEDYFKENGEAVDRTMYEFVRDHFGYRLYADTEATTVTQNGGNISYSVVIKNYGFSRPYTNNAIKMVVLDSENNIIKIANNDTNMLEWQPVNPSGDQSITLKHTIDGNINLDKSITSRTYKIGFYMPSKSVGFENNPEFAIKLANRSGVEKLTVSGKEIFVVKTFSLIATKQQ